MPANVAWFAVRAGDHDAVARALRLRTALPANWSDGLSGCKVEGAFVTCDIDGWVLIIGRDVATCASDRARLESLLEALSDSFELAAWFDIDSEAQRFGWALAERGRMVRAYAYDEPHGHVYWQGDPTDEEHALGCYIDDPRDSSDDEIKWWPDREVVFALASAWTSDPRQLLDAERTPGVGLLGRL